MRELLAKVNKDENSVKNSKKMLEIENTVTEMKNAFVGLRTGHSCGKNLWNWEILSRNPQTEKQKKKRLKIFRISKNCVQMKKRHNIHKMGIPEGKERKEEKKYRK